MDRPARPARLGFPVKAIGRPGLKSEDARRWQSGPHLKVSLELVTAVLEHCAAERIDMYRLSSDLAPYVTHPDLPQFHGQIAESDAELAAFGALARAHDIRLSFHPSQFVLLNSPDPVLTAKSIRDLAAQAEMLDRMGCGPEAVLVTHVGGVYGDHAASRARWLDGYRQCPEPVRRRLVLENDDIRFSAADALWVHGECGVPLVFDYQHFWCLNPEGLALRPTFERFVASWPAGVAPKIHFSTPRTEMREMKVPVDSNKRATLKEAPKPKSKFKTILRPPVLTGHADFINPFEFATFMRMADGLDFDVMLEAKAKDLALLRLRADLLRYAPDVAARFGLEAQDAERLAEDEVQVEAGLEAADAVELDGDDVDEGATGVSA